MLGFVSNQSPPQNVQLGMRNCHVQEMTFWMWRVASVRLDVSLRAVLDPDEGETVTSDLNASGVFSCPLNGISSPPAREEKDQLVDRVGFRGSPTGMILEAEGPFPDTTNSCEAHFCEGSLHQFGQPAHLGWALLGGIKADMLIVQLNTERLSENYVDSGARMFIVGADPILNVPYSHELIIYKSSQDPNLTVSGVATITPAGFYPWKDSNGIALFNTNTGTYA